FANGWSVLLVDPDRISAVVLQKLLEVEGFKVKLVGDGQEAFDLIQDNHYSLVLMDRNLPNVDGLALSRHIRSFSDRSYSYIILLNKMTQKQEMIDSLSAGADDYLTKPYDYVELLARLNSAKRILDFDHRLHEKNRALEKLALQDSLTTAKNRAAYDIEIEREFKRAIRYKHPISIAMCDIDNFKSINDQYGHRVGDQVLVEFVRRVNSVVRLGIDSVFRYTGEMFIIALPETEPENASVLTSRLQYLIEGVPFEVDDVVVDLDVRFGVSGYSKEDTIASQCDSTKEFLMTPSELFKRTDQELKAAKQ
ncbi:MAG: diguanylate cyclase, partial [Pseudomonadota bacterium]